MRYKNEFLAALLKEIALQKEYFGGRPVETIYIGGGTPSLFDVNETGDILEKINACFPVAEQAEITLEANPDDISLQKLAGWKASGVNRLSIGVQSFFEEDLVWMNRAHTAKQAIDNLTLAAGHFKNITIDLIYGTPLLTNEKWQQNVESAIALDIPHLSCYALTVEPKTPLEKMIRQHRAVPVDPESQSEQFLLLMKWMAAAGYEHYEISNFAKPGMRSRHNSSYWQGKQYLGLGPSAHSFDGASRQWNVSNNKVYIDKLNSGMIPFEKETLTSTQMINERIMISLRTNEGLDLAGFPGDVQDALKKESVKYIEGGQLVLLGERLVLTNKGKLLADGIAADLFRT